MSACELDVCAPTSSRTAAPRASLAARLRPVSARLRTFGRNRQGQQRVDLTLSPAYFRRLLPGAQVWQSVFYRGDTGNGKIDWCEADAVIAFEDHLFIVECRGGAFTWTPPATDFDAYFDSLKNLVLKPAKQGSRFVTYLEGAETVAIFDRDKKQIGELTRANYRHITICPVSLDPFTEIAAQVQHLKKIGIDV